MDYGSELRRAVREGRLGQEANVYTKTAGLVVNPSEFEERLQKYAGIIEEIVKKVDEGGYDSVVVNAAFSTTYALVSLQCTIEMEGEAFGETVEEKQLRAHSFVSKENGDLFLVDTETGDSPDLSKGVRGNIFEADNGECSRNIFVHTLVMSGWFISSLGASSITPANGALRLYTGTLVELVLGLGVDINAGNAFGETALMQACCLGRVDICTWLLKQSKIEVNRRTESGATALMMVAEQPTDKHVEIIKLLLSRGADPNLQNKWKTTALHIAAFTGNLAACKLLLEHGAKKENVDEASKTPGFYSKRANCDKSDSGKPKYSEELEKLLVVA